VPHCCRPATRGVGREPPSLVAVTPPPEEQVESGQEEHSHDSTPSPCSRRSRGRAAAPHRRRPTAKKKEESGRTSPPLIQHRRSQEERGRASPRPLRHQRGRGREIAPHHCAPPPEEPGGARPHLATIATTARGAGGELPLLAAIAPVARGDIYQDHIRDGIFWESADDIIAQYFDESIDHKIAAKMVRHAARIFMD